VDALVDLLAEETYAKAAERAIGRAGGAALDAVLSRFERAAPPLRARIVRVIGRLSQGEHESERDRVGVPLLIGALQDADPKTRRNAAIALGHVRAAGVESALLMAWETDPRPEMRRSLAAALGKVGSAQCLELLRAAASADEPEMARIGQRAILMVERTDSRAGRGRIDGTLSPSRPIDVIALARRGLEELLKGELSRISGVSNPEPDGPGRVHVRLAGPLNALFTARTMVAFQLPLPPEPVREGQPVADAIALAMTGETARAVLDAFTLGAVRYRIAWAGGGHRRADTWGTAAAIGRRIPEWVNDPTATLWELLIATRPGFVDVSIVPRGLDDPRFAWRRRDVPAASHPTIAAALARVAGARADDVVWDPFVGSGAELIERAFLGPYRALLGSDVDERALEAARENLAAARVDARLEVADAFSRAPEGITLIVTNPPMGRRAARAPGLAARLDSFVAHATTVLAPGGRLVWVAPWPARARASGLRAGLALDWSRTIDMGGFDAEMQRWVKS
jgi:precorrin-6B methylase 2